MTDLTLRPATPEDAPACARIVSDWIDATDWMPRQRALEEIEANYRDRVFLNRIVTVAEIRGTVAGYLALDRDSDEITALFVGPRGQGVGAALVSAAKQARDQLSLWTFQANAGARRFYAREGFHEVERSAGENDENLPDIRFQWQRGAA